MSRLATRLRTYPTNLRVDVREASDCCVQFLKNGTKCEEEEIGTECIPSISTLRSLYSAFLWKTLRFSEPHGRLSITELVSLSEDARTVYVNIGY